MQCSLERPGILHYVSLESLVAVYTTTIVLLYSSRFLKQPQESVFFFLDVH